MFGFFDGIMKQEQEYERLKTLKQQFKTAKDLGVKECVKCGWCCNRRTCIPTPEEFKKIAEYLRLSVQECIKKYFCVDKQSSDDFCYVKPAGVNQQDLIGKFIPCDRTYNEGKCVFLVDNNLCKIHDVKPLSAKLLECWNDNENEGDEIIKAWKEYYKNNHDLDFINEKNDYDEDDD